MPVDEPAIDALDAVETAPPEAMSFDESAEASADASPWEEPSAPAWSPTAGTNAVDIPSAESFTTAASTFTEASPAPLPEDVTFGDEAAPEPETEARNEAATELVPEPVEDLWSPVAAAAPEEEAQPDLPPEAPPIPIRSADLSADRPAGTGCWCAACR